MNRLTADPSRPLAARRSREAAAGLKWIEPDDAGGPDMAEIVVEDNGPAISDEAFGRMKRVSDSVKEDGLGLGLAIVRNIVDEHGGRLTIVRLSPCGLRVTAALPMCSPAQTQQDEQS